MIARAHRKLPEVRSSATRNPAVYFFANHSAAGGVGELWADLADGLRRQGSKTRLIALWPLPHAPSAADGRSVWTHILDRKPATPLDLLRLGLRLFRLLRTERPDWVLTAMPAANLLVPALAFLSGRGIRAATSHHTPAFTLGWLMGKLDCYAAAIPSVRAAINVSKTVAESYAERAPWLRAKQRVIHNALPPDVERQLASLADRRSTMAETGAPFHVVALGRLSAQKNFDVLVEAVRHLSDVRISIIGKGPDEEKLHALAARLGVQDRITFHGFLAREKALELLASGDVFVQTSRFEGHSLALIEAAKLGLPLVLSNIPVQVEGSTDRAGTPCAVTLDPDDAPGLAGWLDRLRTDAALRADYSVRATRLAGESTFEGMLGLYSALVSSPDSDPARDPGSPARCRAPGGSPVKLTIGIKALNEARHIARSIESALQAAAPFGGEVIVADSGSTDGTLEIAAGYDVRIVQFADLADRSCGAGAQLAYEHARGEFFYLLDGDMEIDPDFLTRAIPFLESHGAYAGVGGRVEEVNAANHEFQVRQELAQKHARYFPRGVDRLDCGGLYRVSAIEEVDYFADWNLRSFEEFELGSRLISAGWRLTRLDMPAVRHFGHTLDSYSLLRRRLVSGHIGGAGQVLRGALGQPHFRQAVLGLSQIRTSVVIIAWWFSLAALAVLAAGHAWSLVLLVGLLAAPLALLVLRRRSFAGGLYSFVAWNATAFGLLTGVTAARRPITDRIRAVILKDDGKVFG